MNEQDFKGRTKKFALAVIRLVEGLPRNPTTQVIGRQLLRCGTSVGANYRAACRGRSVSDVLSKLAIVEEEGDESIYGLEMLVDSGNLKAATAASLLSEADEIVAMTVSSIKTLRARDRQQRTITSPKSKIPNPKSDAPL
jgi:four helix bundle protein